MPSCEFESAARDEVLLPADAHVIGEPVTVTQIRYSGLPRAGLLAICGRGELTYELSLADVVFPTGSTGASLVAGYRAWLGFGPGAALGPDTARPHKVDVDDMSSVSPSILSYSPASRMRCAVVFWVLPAR